MQICPRFMNPIAPHSYMSMTCMDSNLFSLAISIHFKYELSNLIGFLSEDKDIFLTNMVIILSVNRILMVDRMTNKKTEE